jgi:hypothetical protein
VNTLRRDYLVADVSLLVALAATGGAVYFALTAKPSAPSVAITPLPGGAAVGASASF